MKSVNKLSIGFATGFLACSLLLGGGIACAAGVMAEKSANTVYVDGQRVELDTYQINGSNGVFEPAQRKPYHPQV